MKNLKYVNELGGISGEYPDDSEHAGITLYIGTQGSLYEQCIAGDFGVIAPYVAPVVDVNSLRSVMTVTRFQALAALDAAGLLTQVEAIIANPATPNITKLAWNNALEFKRLSPTLITLGAALGLTDEQLDSLFTQAKSIEA